MSDDEKFGIKDKISNEIKSDKRFIIRVILISILIVVGYYLFSPYQNCVSSGYRKAWCTEKTSW
jgi:Ni,Fe-hydrogenase I cytochrome b subunit